jgi:hypothetical protein
MTTSGLESVSTCSSSERPSFGLTGTSGVPGGERGDGGDARLERRLRPDRDALGALEVLRDRGGRLAQLAVAQPRSPTLTAGSPPPSRTFLQHPPQASG